MSGRRHGLRVLGGAGLGSVAPCAWRGGVAPAGPPAVACPAKPAALMVGAGRVNGIDIEAATRPASGPESGPVYVRAELISGGNALISIPAAPSPSAGR